MLVCIDCSGSNGFDFASQFMLLLLLLMGEKINPIINSVQNFTCVIISFRNMNTFSYVFLWNDNAEHKMYNVEIPKEDLE